MKTIKSIDETNALRFFLGLQSMVLVARWLGLVRIVLVNAHSVDIIVVEN